MGACVSERLPLTLVAPSRAPVPAGAPQLLPAFSPGVAANVREIARNNPATEIDLWVDPARFNQRQNRWLQEFVSSSPPNLQSCNLHDLSGYDTPFFSEPDTSANWRDWYGSPIWRQVDGARLLVSADKRNERFRQICYSDADVTNLVVDSPRIQTLLAHRGFFVSGWTGVSPFPTFENQAWGFVPQHRRFFADALAATIDETQRDSQCGIQPFRATLLRYLGGRPLEIVFTVEKDPEANAVSLDF